jgi:hypothetical protein
MSVGDVNPRLPELLPDRWKAAEKPAATTTLPS